MGPQPPSALAPTTRSEVETNKNLSTLSKYEGLAAAMAAELMIGFWFGIGAILAIKMLSSLECCISSLECFFFPFPTFFPVHFYSTFFTCLCQYTHLFLCTPQGTIMKIRSTQICIMPSLP